MTIPAHIGDGDGPWRLEGEEETEAFGALLGREARGGDVLCLTGQLGAGKTRLVRGLCRGLGIVAPVSSPTFGLVHEYPGGRLTVYHFDLYRLERGEELREIGWDDYLDAGGVVAVEWADRFPEWMPPGAAWWRLETAGPQSRRIARSEPARQPGAR